MSGRMQGFLAIDDSPIFEPKNRFKGDSNDCSKKLPICPAPQLIYDLFNILKTGDPKPNFLFRCGIWREKPFSSRATQCTRSCAKVLSQACGQLAPVYKCLYTRVHGVEINCDNISVNIETDFATLNHYISYLSDYSRARAIINNWRENFVPVKPLSDKQLFRMIERMANSLANYVGIGDLLINRNSCHSVENIVEILAQKHGCRFRPKLYFGSDDNCPDRFDDLF